MPELDTNQVVELLTDVKSRLATDAEQRTAMSSRIDQIADNVSRIQQQADGLDLKLSERREGEQKAAQSVAEVIANNEELRKHVEGAGWLNKKGIRLQVPGGTFFPGDLKASTISVGGQSAGSSGVIMPQRVDGDMIRLPRRTLRIRDLLRVRRLTTGNSVDWLKQNVFNNAASPVAESATKPQSDISYTTQTSTVRTIAHWMQVTTQALADIPGLRDDIDSQLIYGLKLKEEDELLTGSGTGQHINGLYTQSTAYDTALNVSGDTRLDTLRHAMYQVELALYEPDGIVVHPYDLMKIDLLKTEEGGANKGTYIVGDVRNGVAVRTIWGLPVVSSMAMTAGTFLVGAFDTGALLFDRMQATVDISYENEDNFVTNEATIRAEERLALAVTRPDSFVKGTFV